jgi:hypothetical protein
MSKRWIKAGSTSQTIDIFVLDSSSTIGAGLTGLVFNTAGLTCYFRKGALGTPTAVTLATLALVTTAWATGGFIAVDATNMPGVYRLDIPNAVIDTAGMVTMYLRGATNMAPVVLELEVVAVDIYDTIRLGLTALPNTACTTNASLITSGTGTAQLSVASGLVTLAGVTHTGAVIPTVTTVTNRVSANTDQWNAVAVTGMPMPTYTQPSGFLAATFPATIASTTNITAGTIGTVSGNVNGNVAGSVGSVTNDVTVGTINANVITAASIATGAIDADALATDAVSEIVNGVWSRDPTDALFNGFAGYWLYQAGVNSQQIVSDTAYQLTTPYIESFADALLNRNVGGGSNSGRLVKEALYALRNKSEIVGATLSVYDAVDVLSWTAAVASSSSAVPVTGIDP